MQLVLDGLEESLGHLGLLIVIDAALLIDVRNLQVKTPFAGPDLPNPSKQLFEIVLPEPASLFQALIVQDESLDDEFPQGLRGPDAELSGLMAVDPIAYRDDGVEMVEVGEILFSVVGSYSEFPNN